MLLTGGSWTGQTDEESKQNNGSQELEDSRNGELAFNGDTSGKTKFWRGVVMKVAQQWKCA